MHLSDDDLLTLSDQHRKHVEQCAECAARLAMVERARKSLNSLPMLTMPNKGWDFVAKASLENVQRDEVKETKTRFWQALSLGLAASLLVVVFSPIFSTDHNFNNQYSRTEITKLINENNKLQAEIAAMKLDLIEEQAAYQILNAQLIEVDSSIQQAYLQKVSNEKKSALWKARRALIKAWLEDKNKTKMISI